ncbi:hypothetical protein V5799_015083 [Amblyomma americanum]|uniref:Reverse transcriptase/retrotransposon-derived protein RNase H-like domain-containing protein n=1 Tax=Amblyomma americanum TaxID=6943 RepID=A0AAQ4E162_AMBAM
MLEAIWESKVRVNFSRPKSHRKRREFPGLMNFPEVSCPALLALPCPSPHGPHTPIDWTSAAETAFEAAKNTLADATLLMHPLADAPLRLITDASGSAVDAVLPALQGDCWCPLDFFCPKLKPAETR